VGGGAGGPNIAMKTDEPGGIFFSKEQLAKAFCIFIIISSHKKF
jgi:hypothetical protein